MKIQNSKKGIAAIAMALIVLLAIIIILTAVPALKQTVLDLISAAK